MSSSIEELKTLQQLLELEQIEEQKRFAHELAQKSLEIRQKEGVTWAPIQVINEEYSAGEKLYLSLEHIHRHTAPRLFEPGAVCAIFNLAGHKKQTLSGVIVSNKEGIITLAINEDDLPDWVEDGKIGLNLYYDETTYKAMNEALQKVMQAKNHTRLAELREIIYGIQPARFKKIDYQLALPNLNVAQNQAIQNAVLADDIAVIHGPPGTGKTTTLVEAIILTLKSEKKTLVCAPGNLAVDLLTEKLAQRKIKTLRIGHPARIRETVLRQTLDKKIEAHPQYQDLKRLRRSAQEQRIVAQKFKRIYIKGERAEQFALARELVQDARRLEKFIIQSIIDDTEAFLCTPVGASHSILAGKEFQTIFIDEAGQMLEPAAWIPITKAKKIVLAGDPYQLPPTVKSLQAAKGGLAISVLEKIMFRQTKLNVEIETLLNQQYRMHEKIMQFSSAKFYDNRLQADSSVANHSLPSNNLLLTQPVEFIDTAGCGFEEEQNPETLSLSNPAEAEILLKHLTQLYEQSITENWQMPTTGIISPYRGQVNYLETLIQSANFSNTNFRVDTIDGFQGQECDIIYISLVRSNSNGEIGFLKDIRRMNVALTRARKKLIIVGDSATISSFEFYADFIDYIYSIDAYRSAWEWL